MSKAKERADVLRDVAERASLLNEFRSDDFQDRVVRIVYGARELWRDKDGELPRPGTDLGFDVLMDLLGAADSSPLTFRDAASRVLRAADGAKASR
jgi:hypothetical protein